VTDKFNLGALDFCRVSENMKPSDALWQSFSLIQSLEEVGYGRYWIAEHHVPEVAHASPEILVAVLAGLTSKIRVGTAGVLLRYYSPLKVANNFRLLNTLYNGRIDLGLARGHVSEAVAAALTGVESNGSTYEQKIAELLDYLRGRARVTSIPFGVAVPEIWLLGTNSESASIASSLGTSYCLGLFLPKAGDSVKYDVLKSYQNGFHPSGECPAPQWAVAVAGVCATSAERARTLAAESLHAVHQTVVGSPTECRELFLRLRDDYQTNEFIFLDVCRHYSDRLESLRLLADYLL
jgi:luciferase family oxidoreductase group 1